MEWVKSKVGYYRVLAIATGSDAMEVMFKRGDALAAEIGQGGFIPDAMLHLLTRRPGQAKRVANDLVKAALWERVKGGYLIVDFAEINAELVRLEAKKKRDRERKAAAREAERAAAEDGQTALLSVDLSADESTDCPTDSLLDHKSKSEKKTAAAAAGAAAAADLPGDIAVLRSKLQAHTPLRGLRFDTLTDDQAGRVSALLEVHGDDPLVRVAIDTCRNPAPTHVTAFLGTWEALPPPGRPLHMVRKRYCDTHGTELSPAGVCSSCAADAHVTPKENR